MRTGVLILLLLLGACSAPEPPLRVALMDDWPPFQIARLAEIRGYYGDKPVRLISFNSPTEARRAYLSGGIDVLAASADHALLLAARDNDHRVITVVDESYGADAVISRQPMTSLAGLKGARIGVESSELGAHILYRLLQRAGLEPYEVEIVFVDVPEHAGALLQNEVDVVITYGTSRAELIEAGGHVIFSTMDMPGEIIAVLIARQSHLVERRDDYVAFVSGWLQGYEYLRRDPVHAAGIVAPYIGLTPAQFLEAIEGVRLMSFADNQAMLGPDNAELVSNIVSYARSMQWYGDLSLPDDVGGLFTDIALPRAVPEPAQ